MVIYTHIIDFLKMFRRQVESYKQCNVYNNIHIDVCFKIQKREVNIQRNTKHAARKTQIDRQVEKKTYTHDIDSWKQANRQGMCVRETEAFIGRALRLDIHTQETQTPSRVSGQTLRGYFGNTILQKSLTCRVEGVSVWWRMREVESVCWRVREVVAGMSR